MSESAPFRVRVRLVALALAGPVGFAAALFTGAASAPAAQGPSGRAIVVDGDTIDIGGERIRLEGIDAPEHAQTCGRKWLGSWACGAGATRALASFIGNRRVDCDNEGHDKYGRILGLCQVDGRDINAEMVRAGYAWAFVKYSSRYVAEEAEARKAESGIWQGEAEPAWVLSREEVARGRDRGAFGLRHQRQRDRLTAASITCRGAPGTRRSRSSPPRASNGFAPRRRQRKRLPPRPVALKFRLAG